MGSVPLTASGTSALMLASGPAPQEWGPSEAGPSHFFGACVGKKKPGNPDFDVHPPNFWILVIIIKTFLSTEQSVCRADVSPGHPRPSLLQQGCARGGGCRAQRPRQGVLGSRAPTQLHQASLKGAARRADSRRRCEQGEEGRSEVRQQLRVWMGCWRRVCEHRRPVRVRAGSEGPSEANNFATDLLGSQSPETAEKCSCACVPRR